VIVFVQLIVDCEFSKLDTLLIFEICFGFFAVAGLEEFLENSLLLVRNSAVEKVKYLHNEEDLIYESVVFCLLCWHQMILCFPMNDF